MTPADHAPKPAVASACKLGSIIPHLPDDVALCILARLPRFLQSRRRLICHSWRDAMEPARMTSIRQALNISEAWPVFASIMYKDREVLFTIIDAVQCRCHNILLPSQFRGHHSSHFDFSVMGAVGSKVFIAAMVNNWSRDTSQIELMQGVYSFDVLSMKWQDSMYASLPTTLTPSLSVRSTIAADMDGGYVYVAGGHGRRDSKSIQGAERLDITTKRWETLPDPHVKRNSAVGVVMGGLFYMIGGLEIYGGTNYKLLKSGEIWDPATREWTLMPELWPGEVFEGSSEDRVVALGDRLYALRRVWAMDQALAEELMYYECVSKTWMSLGYVPLEYKDDEFWSEKVHLLKMGEELWVIHWWKWVYLATKPILADQPLSWRTLPHTFKRGLPVLCGGMVGELRV